MTIIFWKIKPNGDTDDDTSSIKPRNAHVFPGLLKVELPLIVHFKAAGKIKFVHSRYLEKSERLNVDYSIKISWSLTAISSETKIPYLCVGNSIFCL